MRPAGIQERTSQLLSQWGRLRGRCEEQERWLRDLLALADRFWHGLSELALTLSDTQQLVLGLEEAGGEPEAIRTRLRTMQVQGRGPHGQPHGVGSSEPPPHPQALREEIDSLQGELDTLGILGVELMSSCGDPDKPDVTKSLDDVSALTGGPGSVCGGHGSAWGTWGHCSWGRDILRAEQTREKGQACSQAPWVSQGCAAGRVGVPGWCPCTGDCVPGIPRAPWWCRLTCAPCRCPPAPPRAPRGAADPRALPQLYSSWHSLNKVWTERYARLEEQLQASVSYQETMQVGCWGPLRWAPHSPGGLACPMCRERDGDRAPRAPCPPQRLGPSVPSGCSSGWTWLSCASRRSSLLVGTWTWCSSSWQS